MQISLFKDRFFRNNSYLLLLSFLLLLISVFTNKEGAGPGIRAYASRIENYIAASEKKFNDFLADTSLQSRLLTGTQTEAEVKLLNNRTPFLFIYNSIGDSTQPIFWSTQTVVPTDDIVFAKESKGFAKLVNGYYFFQKKQYPGSIAISLLPVKWNYIVSNDYLKNEFAVSPEDGRRFGVAGKAGVPVRTAAGKFLFSLDTAPTINADEQNLLTVWLRILSMLPLLLFIQLAAVHIRRKNGLPKAALFLAGTLLLLRIITYLLPLPVSLRRFELFDPSVYGSDIVLRSLGDLLINAVLFFWVINFIRTYLKGKQPALPAFSEWKKIMILAAGVLVILFVTYTGSGIVRSMVSDSQISFDVINFFSLDIYSVIGFIVLCCIAIGYYYFCRIILFFLKAIYPGFMLPFFLSAAVAGLIFLSFRIGNLSGGFELYELLWLLLFLLLIKNDLTGLFHSGLIVSRMVFWLFFFSATIAAVIITENSRKELRNRQHYAGLIAAKTDPINEVLLNSILTDFRPDMLAANFDAFTNERAAGAFRDSLINNNFSGYTDKYNTKVLVYDSAENALNNSDPVSYNAINSIYNIQAKSTSVPGLFYYDGGYDKFSYLSKKILKDSNGAILAYVYIIVSPRSFESEMLYPELFSRGENNSIENSSEYAFAIYDKGKLVSSHNDYAFSTRYPDKYFAGKQFLSVNKKSYNELWYNAGNDKFVVIVKENRVMIELITLFSYLFCAFLLLAAGSRIFTLLVRSRLRLKRLRQEIQFTIRQQVHGTVIFFSAVSFIIIGVATILFFISRYENNNKETLSRTIRNMETELSASITAETVNSTVFQSAQSSAPGALEALASKISEVHGPDVNIYSLAGDLKASSLPLPYIKGIVSAKIDPVAFFHLSSGREIQYFQKEHIGGLDFVSDYIPVTDSSGTEIAYLNIPYFTSQSRLKKEISNFLVTIINLNAFIFLIAGMAALIITNRITRSFSFISEKMNKINLGRHNETIEWNRNDEIGALVKEYNRMVEKLEESAAALARTERESAWQEMAKQVAHEIKNPLTPMKLSMQFLQRSIENGAPNIKELGAKVSATLVEQIDHLSTIAGEFSRFANIEKASPEILNLNEALRSVQQLYAGNHDIDLSWQFAPDPVMICADKTHINRILTNLILNGIQAVPPGTKPQITVAETISDNNVDIRITDNGAGVSAAAQEKIFTPNFTTKTSGTGLGLAMCKRMAEQAGGDIRYETSGEGTSFFVRLPVVR